MQQIARGNRLHMHAERGGEKDGAVRSAVAGSDPLSVTLFQPSYDGCLDSIYIHIDSRALSFELRDSSCRVELNA